MGELDVAAKVLLQAALAAFADNIFPDVDWAGRMPEELLMGSSVYQRGQAAGELLGQRKLLVRLLTSAWASPPSR